MSFELAENGSRRGDEDSSRSSLTRPEGAIANKKRGMVLPFDQHSITFDEIVYSVDMPQVPIPIPYKFIICHISQFKLKVLFQL